MVTQPKSIATVVAILPVRRSESSTPTEAAVITASVVSGAISEIAPTVVVLPTPNPPATTILTGTGGFAPLAECPESMDHSHDGVAVDRANRMDVEVAGGPEVVDQDPGHVEVQPQPRGDLRDRHRLGAQRDDRLLLRGEPGRWPAGAVEAGGDLRLQPDVRLVAEDPAGGQDERAGRGCAGCGPVGRPRWGYAQKGPDPR